MDSLFVSPISRSTFSSNRDRHISHNDEEILHNNIIYQTPNSNNLNEIRFITDFNNSNDNNDLFYNHVNFDTSKGMEQVFFRLHVRFVATVTKILSPKVTLIYFCFLKNLCILLIFNLFKG